MAEKPTSPSRFTGASRFGASGQHKIGPPVVEQHLGEHHRFGS